MKIIEESMSRLVIRHVSIFPMAFLALCFVGGIYHAVNLITGASDDYFGLFMFTVFPFGIWLACLPITTMELNKGAGYIRHTHFRLFGLSKETTYKFSDVTGVGITRMRGRASDGGGLSNIVLKIADKNVGIMFGRTQLWPRARYDAIVDRIRAYTETGPLPEPERHWSMDLPRPKT